MKMMDANEQFTDSIDALKKTGVRITPQRKAVLKYMIETEEHPTADDIFKALSNEYPNMSVATIYNNLKLFKEDRKSTRLNSSHVAISYAVFCLTKQKQT